MDLVKLTEYLVKALVKNPENVSVKQFESEEDEILIQVLVDSESMGPVIGKGGKMISSIRTIVNASSYINNNKKVRINIDSF